MKSLIGLLLIAGMAGAATPDVGLWTYQGDTARPMPVSPPYTRTVTYPDDYVPMLISKRWAAEVKRILGPEAMVISPRLQ